MSDVGITDAVPTPDAAPPPFSDAGAPPPAADAPPWGDKTPEQLWEQSTELLNENKTYKERYRPFEETFSTLAPEHAEFYHDLARAHAAGDVDRVSSAVAEIQRFYGLTAAQAQKVAQEATQAPGLPEQPQVDPVEAAREAAREEFAIEREKGNILNLISELATEFDLPELAEKGTSFNAALHFRVQQLKGKGDVKDTIRKAAEEIKAEIEKAGQRMLSKKAGTKDTPTLPGGDTLPPSGVEPPRTFKAARAAAKEFRRTQASAASGGIPAA